MKSKPYLSRLLWGIALLAIGILFAGHALFDWDLNQLFRGWWTLFLIVPALVSMAEDGVDTGNAVLLIVGVALLLKARGIGIFSKLSWEVAVAAVLIFIAIKMLLGVFIRKPGHFSFRFRDGFSQDRAEAGDGSKIDGNAFSDLFAEKTYSYAGKRFEGGSYEIRFGDLTVDLIGAELTGDVTLTVRTRFGHALIRTPENVRVEVSSDVSFGEVDNKAKGKTGEYTLTVLADVRFGSLDVR